MSWDRSHIVANKTQALVVGKRKHRLAAAVPLNDDRRCRGCADADDQRDGGGTTLARELLHRGAHEQLPEAPCLRCVVRADS